MTADRRLANMLIGATKSPEAPAGGAAVLVQHAPDGWLASLQRALSNLPHRRRPTPAVVVPLQRERGGSLESCDETTGQREGVDSAGIGPKRSPLRKGAFITSVDGDAALMTRSGVPIVERVHVHLTDRTQGKPAYARSAPFYGEMWLDQGELSSDALKRDPRCSLHWLGLEVTAPDEAAVLVRVHSWSENGRRAQLVGEGSLTPSIK